MVKVMGGSDADDGSDVGDGSNGSDGGGGSAQFYWIGWTIYSREDKTRKYFPYIPYVHEH